MNRIRPAFTLVELMVVTMIIALLASLVLGALFSAQQEAAESRTKAQIGRLHQLLMGKWESYQTRMIRLPPDLRGPGVSTAVRNKYRVDAIRQLMRMEMPDRITDVQDDWQSLAAGDTGVRPALSRAYFRRADKNNNGTIEASEWSPTYQGAECLYLIMTSLDDGVSKGIDHFAAHEIGDIDGDGMPEILDGYGKPIEWIRWAPGYASPLHDDPSAANYATKSAEHPDIFDPMNIYGANHALYPLVFSPGLDGNYDIVAEDKQNPPFRYSQTSPPNNPYNATPQMGAPDANEDGIDGSIDNISNHYLN